jgi:hypothetical protein
VTGSVKVVDGNDGYDLVAFEFTTTTALLRGRPFRFHPWEQDGLTPCIAMKLTG